MRSEIRHRELLVFGREPRPGHVKTRLIPALGADGAAVLYRAMLQHSLQTGGQVMVERRSLWLDAWPAGRQTLTEAEDLGFVVNKQSDGSLGERMAHALEAALRGVDSALLIGSDCPAISPAYLERAFAELARHDAVLGPAADGGYVLIGLRQADARVFDGINWGSDLVLRQTRDRLQGMNWRWAELPTLQDIDEPADLAELPTALRPLAEPR
jgi:rSAM/selenodomain-associated transferase 1